MTSEARIDTRRTLSSELLSEKLGGVYWVNAEGSVELRMGGYVAGGGLSGGHRPGNNPHYVSKSTLFAGDVGRDTAGRGMLELRSACAGTGALSSGRRHL